MANTSSAKKAVRTIARRSEENRTIRSQVKTAVKKCLKADAAQAAELFSSAQKSLDQAASKGVMHKNKAARKKSRLARRVNQAKA